MAKYIARSALRSSVSTSAPCDGYSEMPALGVITSECRASRIGIFGRTMARPSFKAGTQAAWLRPDCFASFKCRCDFSINIDGSSFAPGTAALTPTLTLTYRSTAERG